MIAKMGMSPEQRRPGKSMLQELAGELLTKKVLANCYPCLCFFTDPNNYR